MIRKSLFLALAAVLLFGTIATAQVQSGTITGTVRDEQGGVMPGVTITLTGPQGSRNTVSLANGNYFFRALEPRSYNLSFELSGFATFNREGVVVSSGGTLTIDAVMSVAALAETVTVSGESPVVDVKTTSVASTFDEVELYEVPSATDTWAVLGQTPGVRMRGFDVGGSHKSQQISYESFGMRNQNQVVSDGVNSTEGFGWAAIYYDYYAIEEYKISAAGADVEMMSPGAAIVMTVKSGGNEPSSLIHFDYENESFVSDNVDDETAARGYTGNPNLLFRELHADYGGPIVRDKAWIYGAYAHFKISKAISGVDPDVAADDGIFNNYTVKLTWQATDKDKIVGYSNWMRKEKPNRGLSASRPPENVLGQDYWTWVHKAEWQRVWNDQLFTTFQLNHFGSIWPMVPVVSPDTNPPFFDTAQSLQSGAGWLPFTNIRYKPHVNAIANYYVPDAGGSHDIKFGMHWQIDSEAAGDNGNSGSVRFRTVNNVPNEVRLTSVPVEPSSPDTRNRQLDFFLSDTWSPNNRLTLNLGFRVDFQKAYFLDNEVNPLILQEYPWIAGMQFFDADGNAFQFQQQTISGTIPGFPVNQNRIVPRLGLTYDITGRGESIFKASYGRYNANISQAYSGVHPASTLEIVTRWNDLNGDRALSGPEEVGAVNSISGGGGLTLDVDAPLPYSDEFQFSFEQQLANNTALRASYVHKTYRNAGPDRYFSQNVAQAPFLSVPFQLPDPNGGTISAVTTPADVFGSQSVLTTYPDGADSWDYDTFLISYERRFTDNFMFNAAFDYQWRKEPKKADSISTSPLDSDPVNVGWYQNHNAEFNGNEMDTTNWGFKGMGRYVLDMGLGLSTNIRVQSGFNYSRVIRTPIYAGTGVNVPGAGPSLGTKSIWVEPFENNRSETVPIIDFRADYAFNFAEKYKVSLMFDMYNAFNANPVINFFHTTPNFQNIIAALDARTIKLGVRFQF